VKSFTLGLVLAVAAGLAAAVIITPLAAVGLAASGLRFPFPRIFDRTVMVTLGGALLCFARPLRLAQLLRDGFAEPVSNLRSALSGLALALLAMAALFTTAAELGHGHVAALALIERGLRYAAAAAAIALIEEGFFRAVILAGMARDFGRAAALVLSSAVFALTHLVRSPARFYLTGFHPWAGLEDLGASGARILHPGDALPAIIGLFLLGLVLGEAFILTGRVWFSVGMHAGFVIGAKSWPLLALPGTPIPRWLAGPGPVPLIAAPAAWTVAILLMVLLPILLADSGGPKKSRLARP
jgi:membrane protease YdiL (CAAX protease family)